MRSVNFKSCIEISKIAHEMQYFSCIQQASPVGYPILYVILPINCTYLN